MTRLGVKIFDIGIDASRSAAMGSPFDVLETVAVTGYRNLIPMF